MGYCPCTDWHWQVKVTLGETNLPNSYITYLLEIVTATKWNEDLVDTLTLTGFLSAVVASTFVNIRDLKKRGSDHRKTGMRRTL